MEEQGQHVLLLKASLFAEAAGKHAHKDFAIRSSYVFSWMIRCRQKEYYTESNGSCYPSTLIYLLQGYIVSMAIIWTFTSIFLPFFISGTGNQG